MPRKIIKSMPGTIVLRSWTKPIEEPPTEKVCIRGNECLVGPTPQRLDQFQKQSGGVKKYYKVCRTCSLAEARKKREEKKNDPYKFF